MRGTRFQARLRPRIKSRSAPDISIPERKRQPAVNGERWSGGAVERWSGGVVE
ncbi:MAG: hypothetical protein JNJ83_00440 [Verrucomicrobiaceae bacterium]|nr:hypothetical protein [Verrucomicrobiaceae bacterium]